MLVHEKKIIVKKMFKRSVKPVVLPTLIIFKLTKRNICVHLFCTHKDYIDYCLFFRCQKPSDC